MKLDTHSELVGILGYECVYAIKVSNTEYKPADLYMNKCF